MPYEHPYQKLDHRPRVELRMPDSILVYLNTKLGKIQLFHKGIVCPNGVVRTDVLLDAWRKQLVVLACACDVRHPDLEIGPDSGAIIGNHKRVMTQPENSTSNGRHLLRPARTDHFF